ncbi:hypothetical protein EZS27_034273, partial [termite gut metagenome]
MKKNSSYLFFVLVGICFFTPFQHTISAQTKEESPSSQLTCTYLAPVRVVWKSAEGEARIENEQALLKPGTGQADLVNKYV